MDSTEGDVVRALHGQPDLSLQLGPSQMNKVYSNDTSLKDYWDFLFFELGDPRTSNWPLMGSPLPGLSILAAYLIFVLYLGPKMMANRKPFELKKVLLVYNIIQVNVSLFIVYDALDAVWLRKYSCFRCEPVDWSVTPETMRIARGFYIYFLAKISELLDTVFFVLRKKDRQITFLHMYHHTGMPMAAWGAAKYYPGGHASFIGLINSFVHVIMYTYYLLAALGPKVQKYLWWKKYLTTLQLLQFCIAFLHFTQLLFQPDCDYPRWSVIIVLPNTVFFYYLFADFYKKAYGRDDHRDERTLKQNGCEQNGKLTNGHSAVKKHL